MSSWMIQNVKLLSLGCLVAQNCALVLTMRHSLTAEGNRYIKSTAVALMEVSEKHRANDRLRCVAFFPFSLASERRNAQRRYGGRSFCPRVHMDSSCIELIGVESFMFN